MTECVGCISMGNCAIFPCGKIMKGEVYGKSKNDVDGSTKDANEHRVKSESPQVSCMPENVGRVENYIGEMVRNVLTFSSDPMYNKGYTDALMEVLAWLEKEL